MTVPRRTTLLVVWCTAAVLLAALVASVRVTQSDADDVDPAWQRPGILDLGDLPEPAPALPGTQLAGGSPTVVFFAAAARIERLCQALDGWDRPDELAVVVVGSGSPNCGAGVTTVDTASSGPASSFGLRQPAGDVEPTGYAIVDGAGQIRYRTLDPVAAALLDEVSTMVRGL